MRLVLIIAISFFGVNTNIAQFSGTNLLEIQYGKLPNESADPFPSLYNRTIINFRKGKFKISGTLSQYYTEIEDRNYIHPAQLSLQYKNKHWDLKLGNFYETLGRGFLLRSYEINGAILEDFGFRSRTYFHRDVLGTSVKYRKKKFSIHVMGGKVLNNLLPPTFDSDERRTDSYVSLATKYTYYKKHKAEVILFNFRNDQSGTNRLISASVDGPLPGNIEYHATYVASADQSDQYAFYGSLTGYVSNLSYTLEYKKYENFILGAGINEPPQGIKEQTYRVLNRSTHVSNPLSEDGYQVELVYGLDNGSRLTLNHALASNQFGSTSFTFQQYFAEWSSTLSKKIDYKFFLDLSIDDLKGEDNRWSTGLYTDMAVNKKIRFSPEFEYQRFDRGDNSVYNQFYSFGVNYSSKWNFNIQMESTSDPFLVRDNKTNRFYVGSNLQYKINQNNTIRLFGGSRRGGPACSAGVCYEILDFQGIETRWSSRF